MIKLLTWLIAKRAGLGPATTRKIVVERGLRIPMPDGVELYCDRYYPALPGAEQLPILLNRTPYGRLAEGLIGRLCAARGYQVVIVSCRGTFESGGTWEPFFTEQADGQAAFEWLSRQPWFSGKVGTIGGSYHGMTQWAVMEQLPAFVRAVALNVTQSNFADFMYPGSDGLMSLESALTWIGGNEYQERPLLQGLAARRRVAKKVHAAANALPIAGCDTALLGRQIGCYQDWIANQDRRGPYWSRIDFGKNPEKLPPAFLGAGWYDIFAAGQLRDYVALKQAGNSARLVVGPWHHGSIDSTLSYVREALRWNDLHLKGIAPADDHPVRLFVMGSKRWVDFPEWPPPARRVRWHLQDKRGLATAMPSASTPDHYRYDPADPTPAVGGTSLNGLNAGPRDNRATEARTDVLSYTSAVLDTDLTVIGPISADLQVRSSLDHTDFFVRLCDVSPDGRSTNICDGMLRLSPASIERADDGSFAVRVELTPTANTFLRGHCIRVQIASGAFPLYSRNNGTGEPIRDAVRLIAAEQQVLHDPEHASAIELPIVSLPHSSP